MPTAAGESSPRPGDKRPAITGWEERATSDRSRIGQAWSSAPYNIGIACGPSNLVVIDFDVPKPGHKILDEWAGASITSGADVLTVLAEIQEAPAVRATYTVSESRVACPLGGSFGARVELRAYQPAQTWPCTDDDGRRQGAEQHEPRGKCSRHHCFTPMTSLVRSQYRPRRSSRFEIFGPGLCRCSDLPFRCGTRAGRRAVVHIRTAPCHRAALASFRRRSRDRRFSAYRLTGSSTRCRKGYDGCSSWSTPQCAGHRGPGRARELRPVPPRGHRRG